jgi:hypothetical protein
MPTRKQHDTPSAYASKTAADLPVGSGGKLDACSACTQYNRFDCILSRSAGWTAPLRYMHLSYGVMIVTAPGEEAEKCVPAPLPVAGVRGGLACTVPMVPSM